MRLFSVRSYPLCLLTPLTGIPASSTPVSGNRAPSTLHGGREKSRWTSGMTPKINTLDRDRTCNLQLRRLTLYPIELRGRGPPRFYTPSAAGNRQRPRVVVERRPPGFRPGLLCGHASIKAPVGIRTRVHKSPRWQADTRRQKYPMIFGCASIKAPGGNRGVGAGSTRYVGAEPTHACGPPVRPTA